MRGEIYAKPHFLEHCAILFMRFSQTRKKIMKLCTHRYTVEVSVAWLAGLSPLPVSLLDMRPDFVGGVIIFAHNLCLRMYFVRLLQKSDKFLLSFTVYCMLPV